MVADSKFRERRVKAGMRARCKGQATIELALVLPLIIWLMFYTFNAFQTIHTAHIATSYAAMDLYKGLNNRAMFVMDDAANGGQGVLHNKNFMAYQYMRPDGRPPTRRILKGPVEIDAVVGICREPSCQ